MITSRATVGPSQQPRIVLITPVRDEEQYIAPMIGSIFSQTISPTRWLIVDDGSTDATPAIVRQWAQRCDYIELLQLPPRTERRAGGEGAIAFALSRIDLSQFDYLARFDADLLFPKDYYARILAEFDKDAGLGIAGGGLYIERNGRLELERVPQYHVRGALKMYRRTCFEQLGGLSAQIGWDTMDEVTAWSRGWRTRSFPEIPVIHRRPTGKGLAARLVYTERGRAEYLTWSHPAFVVAKALKLALYSPNTALFFMRGFLGACWTHPYRIQDPEFARARRKQQIARMRGISDPWAG